MERVRRREISATTAQERARPGQGGWSDARETLLTDLADLLDLWEADAQRGHTVSVEEFVQKYCADSPRGAARLRQLLQTAVDTEVAAGLAAAASTDRGPDNLGVPPRSADGAPPQDVELDGYELLQEIGRGGFGVVYFAVSRSAPQAAEYAAVKVIRKDRPDCQTEVAGVRNFNHQAQQSAELAECFVGARFIGETDGYYYLILDYADDELDRRAVHRGGRYTPLSLQRLIDTKRRLTADEALQLAATLVRGLKVLHDRFGAHFDIKPSNVLSFHMPPNRLEFGNWWKIADVGFVAHRGEVHGRRGTPGYHHLAAAENDPQQDLYAVGKTLYAVHVLGLPTDEERSPITLPPECPPRSRTPRPLAAFGESSGGCAPTTSARGITAPVRSCGTSPTFAARGRPSMAGLPSRTMCHP